MKRILSGRIVKPNSVFPEYEVVVENAYFSWTKFRRVVEQQAFRGNGLWKLHPQNSDADVDMESWLNVQTKQMVWAVDETAHDEAVARMASKFDKFRNVVDELGADSCTCGSKGSPVALHDAQCKYRTSIEAIDVLENGLETMIRAG